MTLDLRLEQQLSHAAVVDARTFLTGHHRVVHDASLWRHSDGANMQRIIYVPSSRPRF